MTVSEMASDILAQILPDTMLTDDDVAVIAENKEFLLGLEADLVALFYDTAYAHPPTAAIFEEGERPAREETLSNWWRRTINGPLDDSYMRWMTLVGVIHIRRGVKNPMMLSMVSVVMDAVHKAALADLDADTTEKLNTAFGHLSATVSALISESYTSAYIGALQDLAGLKPALVDNMLGIEVKKLEAEGREQL